MLIELELDEKYCLWKSKDRLCPFVDEWADECSIFESTDSPGQQKLQFDDHHDIRCPQCLEKEKEQENADK